MAITKTIVIKADSKDAVKGIEEVTGALGEVEGQAEEAEDAIDKVGKAAKQQGKVVRGLGSSVRVVGKALKALGIGLIIALVAKMAEVFSRNQKAMDFFSTALETLSIVFNDLFALISDNFLPAFEKLKTFFKNLTFDKIKNAIKKNLIERFESLLEVIGFVGTALRKLFEGDFKGALESIKEAGKEMGDVMTGVPDLFDKVTDSLSELNKKASEYFKTVVSIAAANIQLANSAQIAAAQQSRLVEQFDRLAEKQRQIRDDESKSIKDRQEANEKLGKILEEQESSMIKLADLQVAAAQAVLNTNNNIENQVALIDALANKEGILAQVEGFRSEQIVNRIALKREEIELNQTISDSEKERQLSQLEFDESQAEREDQKLELQRQRLEIENQIILDDLERKRELFALGTQSRIDAEQDFLTRKQDIDNKLIENTKKTNDLIKKDDKIVQDTKIKLASTTFGIIQTLLDENSKLGKAAAVAAATINTFEGITTELRTKTATPFEFGLKLANIAATAVIGFKAVKDILSTSPSSVSSAPSISAPSAPSFNLVEGTEANQISTALQATPEPLRAVVVSGDVTTAQSVDRNIVEGSGL